MATVVITRRSDYRLSIELSDDEGNVIHQRMISRFKEPDIRLVANITQQHVSEVRASLNACCENKDRNGDYDTLTIQCEPPSALIQSITGVSSDFQSVNNFTIYVRDINQPKRFAESFVEYEPQKALDQALDSELQLSEPLLEWDDKARLCCLDIDYHGLEIKKRPDYSELKKIVSFIRPQPYCWHPSHRGGAKLYYVATPGFTSEELAAVAGVHWMQRDPRATFDLIKSTRHPKYKRSSDNAPAPINDTVKITRTLGNGDLSVVKKLLLSEVEDSDIQQYLSEHSWYMGQTLPHTECPIAPNNDTKLNVFVGEKGLYCHRCKALGLGANGSGMVTWGAMIGGSDNRITTMVRNFCHLEHARIILSNIFPNVPLGTLEIVYKVMMKIVHSPDDPRITLAMVSGKGYVRSNGIWVRSDGRSTLQQNLLTFTKSLPGVLIPTDDGYGINVAKHTALSNTGDAEEYGYPNISFLRGCKIYSQFMKLRSSENTHVVVRPEFAKCPPTYLPKSKRMPDAWGLLNHEFPGIDFNYVKLLIGAKGSSEGRMAQCPFLLITGPSGSGKSTTPQIVAGICGDKAEEPIFTPNPERFRASLMDSAAQSSFVVINEIFKSADLAKLNHIQALTQMLSLTEDSRSHVLYVGSVSFGKLPVFVLTDVNVPTEIESDIQIARRFIYYRLSNRNYWEETLSTKGIRPHEFRLLSPDHTLAADTILSEVIDEYFQAPTTLKAIADSLSAESLESWSEDLGNKQDKMKEFYREVLSAPLLQGSDARRYTPAKGWKKVDRNVGNRILELWNDLCDGPNQEQWNKARTIEGEDWSKLLGTKFPVVCDIRTYQHSIVYVRFRSADSQKHPHWINGKSYV